METQRVEMGHLRVRNEGEWMYIEVGPTRWQEIKIDRRTAVWLRNLLNAFLSGFPD
tara:strand:- start:2632 stop:2799 length:168 start_codon:yes stop_codon:yes gene_type:complete